MSFGAKICFIAGGVLLVVCGYLYFFDFEGDLLEEMETDTIFGKKRKNECLTSNSVY